jgi:DNA-binding CsgD family transcriptional regulator
VAADLLQRLAAQVAATDGDLPAASRLLGPLLQLAEAESVDPGEWRSLLLAVRIESDRASQSTRYRRDKSATARIAECQIAAGDRTGAVDSLMRARQIGANLRAAPLLDAIDDIARRARLDLHTDDQPRTRKPQPHGLTTRELEVLQLIANGRTNDQIASELFISPKTASVHVSHILTKLDVGRRSEATTAANRLHLLDTGDGT